MDSGALYSYGEHAVSCAIGKVRCYARGRLVTMAATLPLEVPSERNFWRDAVYATLIGRGPSMAAAIADLGESYARARGVW